MIFLHISISTVICNTLVNSDNTADKSTAGGELSESRSLVAQIVGPPLSLSTGADLGQACC